MRSTLIPALSLLAVAAFAGCINEVDDAPASGDDGLAALAPGTVLGVDKKVWEGTLSAGTTHPTAGCGSVGEGVDKKTFEWEFPAAMDGVNMSVKGVLITLTSSATGADNDVFFLDPDGEVVGSGTSPASGETIEVTDTLKPGTYKLIVVSCIGVNSTFKLVGEATHVAA